MKFLGFVLVLITHLSLGQSPILIDSLKRELAVSNDSISQILLADLAWEYCYSNIDSAEFFGLAGLELAKKRNHADDLIKAKGVLAIIYDINGDDRQSAKLYLEVAKYYEEQNNIVELSKTYNNLGVLFYYNEDYSKSEEYFLESMAIDEQLGDSLGIATSLINLAAISNYSDNYSQSFKYLNRSKNIAVELRDNADILASVYRELAATSEYVGNHDSTIYYSRKALPEFIQSNDRHSILSSYNSLMGAYSSLGNYDSALFYLNRAQKFSNSYDDIILRRSRYERGSKIYAALGDFENAYLFQSKYLSDNDSITSMDRIKAINELEEKYQSEQKEMAIAKLQIEQQKSNNERTVLIFSILLILATSVLLFGLYRVKSKSEATIAKSLTEKETLLREIHHRVKNNLQVVSSLLSMQSRFIEDEKALGAVSEGQSRVESMALIHQKLYQDSNISSVNVLDYVKDLTETLRRSYTTETEIHFQYEVDELHIDVDTIIPIGLILNELICNSLKHAFPNKTEGTITVKLNEQVNKLRMEVSDDGVGANAPIKSKNSFGSVLIDSLAAKLKATLSIENEHGMCTVLNITRYKLA